MKELLDCKLELNPADLSLNKKWAKGQGEQAVRLSKTYSQLKKDLRAQFREDRSGFAAKGDVHVSVEIKGRCDIDAPLKLLLDALQSSVYANDSQVNFLSVRRIHSDNSFYLWVYASMPYGT